MVDNISLSDAWRAFFDDHTGLLKDPMHTRPASGIREWEQVKNPKTRLMEHVLKNGPAFAPGVFDVNREEMLAARFEHEICVRLDEMNAVFVKDRRQFKSISIDEWFDACRAFFFATTVYKLEEPLRDGGPESWEIRTPGADFPLAIYFDRAAFEGIQPNLNQAHRRMAYKNRPSTRRNYRPLLHKCSTAPAGRIRDPLRAPCPPAPAALGWDRGVRRPWSLTPGAGWGF